MQFKEILPPSTFLVDGIYFLKGFNNKVINLKTMELTEFPANFEIVHEKEIIKLLGFELENE